MFWKARQRKKTDKDGHLDNIHNSAWYDATKALSFYIDFRTKYNLAYSHRMWADDFSLGFRDGIGHVHFSLRRPEMADASSAQFDWQFDVIEKDIDLAEIWVRIISDKGGHTERGEKGFMCALILETWRLGQEFTPGALDYIKQHEIEYRERYPDATQFNMDHWLIMSHFVLHLIDTDKNVHPAIQEHFRGAL